MARPNPNLIGFLLLSYAILGLAGVFASYAAPLPLERAQARETALDEALATAGQPDEAARLAALAPRLDDSAAAVLHGPAPLPDRVARERVAMRARLAQEDAALGFRLRLLLGLVTLTAGAFGVAMLGAGHRAD